MLISSSLFAKSVEKYRSAKKARESYGWDDARRDINLLFETTLLILASILLVFEFLLFVYAIFLAINCTSGGPERVVHIVLAVFFTIPYVLVSVFMSQCAKESLGGSGFFPDSLVSHLKPQPEKAQFGMCSAAPNFRFY